MNISEIAPKSVFKYFYEISQIPHGSGNTEAIARYCMDFAEKRGLRAIYDKGGNVIIFKDGTNGFESAEPVIIQGHLDMVCEKTADCPLDMQKDSLKLITDGEWLWADRTTLGGDDGIAVAYALALLDSDTIPHPPLEILLTRDEETGMFGAAELEPAPFKGTRLINIDSEEEGIFTVGCAGGITAHCELALDFTDSRSFGFEISVTGGNGGHSGVDINKYRINAIRLLAEMLNRLNLQFNIGISELSGGDKNNVIPSSAYAVISSDTDIIPYVSEFNNGLKKQAGTAEPNICITAKSVSVPEQSTDKASTDKAIFALLQAPCGVQSMNADIPDSVSTSLNLGSAVICRTGLKAGFLLRSSSAHEKKLLSDKLTAFTHFLGGNIIFDGDYPAWEYAQNSPLRTKMTEIYEKLYGKSPKIESIHAGLECGILSEKLGISDIVSIGPDMEHIHSPKERLNIASVKRTWEFLLELLKEL